MKTWWKTTLLLLLVLIGLQTAWTMRQRGEAYPSLRLSNVRKPVALSEQAAPESRIVDGQLVAAGEAPWMVSVQNQYGNHICGGAIINESWVMTAASCVAGLRPNKMEVMTGTVDWWNISAPSYYVEDIHMHCNFDKPLYHNDVALLKLKEPIEFNDVTASIELAPLHELEAGDKLTFTGWGSPSNDGEYQQFLYKGVGSFVPYEQCKSILGNTDDVDLGHVCVLAAAGKGACHGDTGGPLVNAEGQLVGVGNWGVPCGHGFPDMYAGVSFYYDWVQSSQYGCDITIIQ